MLETITAAALALVLAWHPGLPRPSSDLFCLTEAIYREARSTSPKAQRAVAHVIRNRVRDTSGRWPGTYCAVIGQKGQFSWTRKRQRNRTFEQKAWDQAVQIAVKVISNPGPDPSRGATHFCVKRDSRAAWCHAARPVPGVEEFRFATTQ